MTQDLLTQFEFSLDGLVCLNYLIALISKRFYYHFLKCYHCRITIVLLIVIGLLLRINDVMEYDVDVLTKFELFLNGCGFRIF